MQVGHFDNWFRPRMADDELRRVSPDIAAKVGHIGNLGGTAGIVLVPLWDGGLFLFSSLRKFLDYYNEKIILTNIVKMAGRI